MHQASLKFAFPDPNRRFRVGLLGPEGSQESDPAKEAPERPIIFSCARWFRKPSGAN